ncbi:unnamed protein product [Sphacelaria rigidula]
MSSSTVRDIDNKFTSRLTRPDRLVGRPINPFATTSSQTPKSFSSEEQLKLEISATTKLGAEYQGNVVDTKFERQVSFDRYTVMTNPKAGYKLHTTGRMPVEHTREK